MDHYQVTTRLAQGTEGIVFLAQNSNHPDKKFVIKAFHCSSKTELDHMTDQVRVLISDWRHEHIVRHFEFFTEQISDDDDVDHFVDCMEQQQQQYRLYVAMNYCSKGTLDEYLYYHQHTQHNNHTNNNNHTTNTNNHTNNNHTTTNQQSLYNYESDDRLNVSSSLLWKWLCQISDAIRYFHVDKSEAHRDLKAENILLCDRCHDLHMNFIYDNLTHQNHHCTNNHDDNMSHEDSSSSSSSSQCNNNNNNSNNNSSSGSSNGSSSSNSIDAVLCDFGITKWNHTNNQSVPNLGSPLYMSPQIMNRSIFDGNLESDIWSFGILILQCMLLCCSRELPPVVQMVADDSDAIIRYVKQKQQENSSEMTLDQKSQFRPLLGHHDLLMLCHDCCVINPSDRPTIQQVHERLLSMHLLAQSSSSSSSVSTIDAVVRPQQRLRNRMVLKGISVRPTHSSMSSPEAESSPPVSSSSDSEGFSDASPATSILHTGSSSISSMDSQPSTPTTDMMTTATDSSPSNGGSSKTSRKSPAIRSSMRFANLRNKLSRPFHKGGDSTSSSSSNVSPTVVSSPTASSTDELSSSSPAPTDTSTATSTSGSSNGNNNSSSNSRRTNRIRGWRSENRTNVIRALVPISTSESEPEQLARGLRRVVQSNSTPTPPSTNEPPTTDIELQPVDKQTIEAAEKILHQDLDDSERDEGDELSTSPSQKCFVM